MPKRQAKSAISPALKSLGRQRPIANPVAAVVKSAVKGIPGGAAAIEIYTMIWEDLNDVQD